MRLGVVILLNLLLLQALSAQPKVAIPPADDVEAAKAHFAAGSAYYEQANYLDAVKEFNEAYRLSKRHDLLYNIAVSYERLNQLDDAITALEKYLREKPTAPDRVTIRSRIENLSKKRRDEQSAAKRAAVPTPTPTPVPVPVPVGPSPPPAPRDSPPRPRSWYVPGAAVGGIGVGLLLGALGTGIGADQIHTDLKTKCPNDICDTSLTGEFNTGRALGITADVLLGVGAALAVTGAILLIVKSRRPPLRQARLRLLPSAAGLAGRF